MENIAEVVFFFFSSPSVVCGGRGEVGIGETGGGRETVIKHNEAIKLRQMTDCASGSTSRASKNLNILDEILSA